MCQKIAAARVDEDCTATRDADIQFVVVAGVLIGGGLGGADSGPDAVGDLFGGAVKEGESFGSGVRFGLSLACRCLPLGDGGSGAITSNETGGQD
jgi:hypothetical protein